MKWNEKAQYKAKNYLYEKERTKQNKPQTNENTGLFGSLIQTLDEIDLYIGEKVNHYFPKKDEKNDN